jgi:hypothetical protein
MDWQEFCGEVSRLPRDDQKQFSLQSKNLLNTALPRFCEGLRRLKDASNGELRFTVGLGDSFLGQQPLIVHVEGLKRPIDVSYNGGNFLTPDRPLHVTMPGLSGMDTPLGYGEREALNLIYDEAVRGGLINPKGTPNRVKAIAEPV